MPWYQGHLIDVVGEGVLSEALEQAAAREQQEPDGPHKAFAMAYFEALRGELAWRKGALKEAIAFAEKALGGLPERAALLRRRVMAWYGDSLLRRGRHDDARTQFQEVLQHYPTTFRHLGLTLPVSFSDDGSPQARALVAVLKNSRRLAPGNLGFQVRAQLSNERLELCLATERGHHFQCVVEPAAKHAKTEALESRLLAMADLFHAKGFAPGIELTQRDINTLDGSPTRGNVDDVLKGILGDPRRDQESAP